MGTIWQALIRNSEANSAQQDRITQHVSLPPSSRGVGQMPHVGQELAVWGATVDKPLARAGDRSVFKVGPCGSRLGGGGLVSGFQSDHRGLDEMAQWSWL